MLSLEVAVNGVRVTTAGVIDAEKIEAAVTICPGISESWVRVAGDVIPDKNPPADASWFHRPLAQGDSVTISLVDSPAPSEPTLTRSDPSAAPTDSIPFACSFCNKPNTEIERMWAGPRAQICNECVQFMHETAIADGIGSNTSLERTRD
jgi:hypothetical protein